MLFVFIINSVIVFLALLESKRIIKYGLVGSFLVLFFFLALRYDFGNDYHGYLLGFKEINSIKNVSFFGGEYHYEAGWVFLCKLFKPFGFFSMMAALALFNCWVYYRFIKKYVPVSYYWFAVFIYVFSPGMMLTHSSAMRQSIAIALFILAIDYIVKKKMILFFVLMGVAWLFHSSALILLPFYFLSYFKVQLKWKSQLAFISIFLILFILNKSLSPIINNIIIINFGQYEVYDESGQIGMGLGVLVLSFLFCLVLYFDKHQVFANGILFKLSIVSFLFIPLGLIIFMLGRIGMYFQVANIAVFPLLYFSIRKSIWKFIPLLIILLFTLYTFYGFFQSETYKSAFSTYKTIFSSH